MTCQRAPFRLLRTVAVAVSVLSLAAAAHVAGGGRLPQVPVLAACTALVFLAVIVLTRWKLQLPALALLLTGGQGLLHTLLSALSPAGVDTAATFTAGTHQHRFVGAGAPLPAGQDEHLHTVWDTEPAMFSAHLAATFATAVLLAKGEAALWALAAWLHPVLFPSPVTFVHLPAQPLRAPRRAPLPRPRMLRAHPRRGPPATGVKPAVRPPAAAQEPAGPFTGTPCARSFRRKPP